MATLSFDIGDGKTATITVPDDAPDDYIETIVSEIRAGAAGAADSEAALGEPPDVRPHNIIRGARDPIDAAAQLLERSLPDFMSQGINSANDWLVDQGVPLQRLGDEGLQGQLNRNEQEYQQKRADAGQTGFDDGRLFGNMLSPANLVVGPRMAAAGSLPAAAGRGAAMGAGLGLVADPVTGETAENNFWGEKLSDMAAGGSGGALFGTVGNLGRRALSPPGLKDPDIQRMVDEGIRLTPGQLMGGRVKASEDTLTSNRGVGYDIQEARKRGYEDMNRRPLEKSLALVGERLPANVGPQDALKYTRQTLGRKYDELLPRLSAKMDDQFENDVGKLTAMVDALPPEISAQFRSIVNRELGGRVSPNGTFSGQNLKDVQQQLRLEAGKYQGKDDAFQSQLGDALGELGKSFEDLIIRNNPEMGERLRNLNRAYGMFKIKQRASSALGADRGEVTPAQLLNSVKVSDTTLDKRAFSEGDALMQDYAQSAKAVLPGQYPDSGTAGRSGGNTAYGDVKKLLTLPMRPLYSERGIDIMGSLLGQRPRWADRLERMMGFGEPAGIAMGSYTGVDTMDQMGGGQ